MYGDYKELLLQTTHFAYARILDGKSVITTVNNADNEVIMNLQAGNSAEYVGALTGEKVSVNGGHIQVKVSANSGEVWIPAEMYMESFATIGTVKIEKASVKTETVKAAETAKKAEPVKAVEMPKVEETVKQTAQSKTEEPEKEPAKAEVKAEKVVADWNKPYEDMTVEELQEAILEKMRKNGPVTDYMLGTVRENTHQGSLICWVKSFI